MAENNQFGHDEMVALLGDIYADWVRALNIKPVAPIEGGYRFLLPKNPAITRDGDIVCGQSISAVSDSVGVLSLSHQQQSFRAMTTVKLDTIFMLPLFLGDVIIDAQNLKNGKRLATVRVDFRQNETAKIAATSNVIYAYL